MQLIEQIKQAIHEQRLQKGDKLPSKRRLAQHLQISPNTVETAYSQLCTEGYLDSIEKIGFFVNVQVGDALLNKQFNKVGQQKRLSLISNNPYDYDFNPHRVDSGYFPFERWKKINKQILNKNHSELLHLNNAQGDGDLREQLSFYLNSARGVICDPSQIVVASGVEQLMQILMLILDGEVPENLIYGIEEFGYKLVENLFKIYQKKWKIIC